MNPASGAIYEFTVPVSAGPAANGHHVLQIPLPGHVLHVASQTGRTDDGVQFWVAVDHKQDGITESRYFKVIATGETVDFRTHRYCGTALCGGFVWHLVEWVQ